MTQHKHRYGMELKDKVARSFYSTAAKIDKDRFMLKKSYLRNFYNNSIYNVKIEMQNLLEKLKAHGIKKLLVVGGHSSSTMVTDELKTTFKDLVIVVLKEPFSTVMKGAVLYGLEPLTVMRLSNKPPDPDDEGSLGLQRSIVAAIDFGTTYSGFAYCKRTAFDKNPVTAPIIIHTWHAYTHITQKAPTCVLFKPDRTFHSFGYDAIHYYQENPEKKDFKDWYYFEHFKMILYKADELTTKTVLVASNDTSDSKKTQMKAVDVFAAVIKLMKNQLFEDIQNTGTFTDEDILWVITVPAIWDLRARQFMREAAKKADISNDQILLALEPEAASLYCRRVPVGVKSVGGGRKEISSMTEGSKYIVLDQGGGTTDIAIHEINGLHTLKEIHQACGGHWGGITVNREFEKFIKQLVGEDFLNHMRKEDSSAYFSLFHSFELVKTSFTSEDESDENGIVTIRLPASWMTHYNNRHDMELHERVKNSNFSDVASLKSDKLRLKKSFFRKFYNYSIKSIKNEIQNILKKPQVCSIETLLVVGGHSSSTVLIDSLKKSFDDLVIVVPKDPASTVMKGAVLYGLEPGTITCRVSRFTYGVETTRAFKPGDPEKKKFLAEGKETCDDVFSKHIDIGEKVEVGEDKYQPAKEYAPLCKNQKEVSFKFYDSVNASPKFTTDSGCRYIGSLLFKLTKTTGDRLMDLEINFGGTEIKARVTEKDTENTTYGYFMLPSETN